MIFIFITTYNYTRLYNALWGHLSELLGASQQPRHNKLMQKKDFFGVFYLFDLLSCLTHASCLNENQTSSTQT